MKRPVRLKTIVIDTHLANPTWSSRQIADALHIPQSRVTMYATKCQLKLPRGLKKRPQPAAAKPAPRAVLLQKARAYLAARPPAVLAYLGVGMPEAVE